MSVPNIGPEPFDPTDGADVSRRGNPAHYCADHLPDGMAAATTRAATVSHRFGGVRYALTRRDGIPPSEGDQQGEPSADH
ncbi:hypothetical protein AB0M36_31875 [Actinoplanes sp. NPDC051346]|uniref:hypothetical protein n=1 Tax=Actinoplanes sp. NPDC051346 TaxID=3155048 RepID=UPI00341989DD